jgi:hypothetical protein
MKNDNYRYDVPVKDSTSWKFKFVRENAGKDEIWQEGEVDSNQATEILLSTIDLFMNERRKEGNSEKLKHWAIAKQELIEARKK